MRVKGFSLFFIGLLTGLASCQKPIPTDCAQTGSLRKSADFDIGTTYDAGSTNPNWNVPDKIKNNFSRFTTENTFKMDFLYPQPGTTRIWHLRKTHNMGRVNDMKVHVHPVIWHEQLPQWLNKSNADSLFRHHIFYCSFQLHYPNIQGIDVVNEALLSDGSFRPSIWYEVLGKEYIFDAFQILTDSAIIKAKLFYNDYNLILNPRKLDAALDLCDWVRKRGARVDGIGIQMHVNIYEPHIPEFAIALEKIWRRGYMVHISELDVSLNPLGKDVELKDLDYQRQARVYRDIVRTYKATVPQAYQYGITLWGFSDADSWIPREFNRVDAPLLFDYQGNAKPAYCGFLDGLK